tara:strand:+ start:1764 stop:2588 length:825 start_codon:yes stop_codon:yes gene_type:complete
MSENNDDSKRTQIGWAFVSFVCWCIVYAKTNRETFEDLGSGTFYDLASISLWGNVSFLGLAFVTSIIVAAGIVTDNDCCISIGKLLGGLSTFAFLGVLITQFVFMCMIFHNDKEHFFLVNKAFWRSRAFNYTALEHTVPSSHPSIGQHIVSKPSEVWPYDMADLLVRIPWGILMALLFLLVGLAVLFGVSAGLSYACKMCCGSETSTTRQTTLARQARSNARSVPRETGGSDVIQTHVDAVRNGQTSVYTPSAIRAASAATYTAASLSRVGSVV